MVRADVKMREAVKLKMNEVAKIRVLSEVSIGRQVL